MICNYNFGNRQLQLGLTEAYDNLINQIPAWEHRYVLKSPFYGTVILTQYWTVNQQVRAGDVVMIVIPKGVPKLGKSVCRSRGRDRCKPGNE
ncbi:hypothetical protein BGS_1218 [Beggiatoa sp. SS]|nr:hypothetical protein BGS_1218 [Beggiatoa sp. SS]